MGVRDALGRSAKIPAGALTFSVHVGVGKRLLNGAAPDSRFQVSRRLVVDYRARVEVRRVGSAAVLGSVDTIASGAANEPEVDEGGQTHGAMQAIDNALEKASTWAFAPGLLTQRRTTLLVEIPSRRRGPASSASWRSWQRSP